MKIAREGELLGKCVTCRNSIYDLKFRGRPSELRIWWHKFSTIFNGTWLCGICLSAISQKAREANQAEIKYKKSKPTREYMQRKHGIYVNPETGKIETVDVKKWSKL